MHAPCRGRSAHGTSGIAFCEDWAWTTSLSSPSQSVSFPSFTRQPVRLVELRPTAPFLNIVAAGYATWRLKRHDLIDWRFLANLAVSSVVFSFIGGLIAFGREAYSMITGSLLVAAAVLMIRQRVEIRDEQRHRSRWPTISLGAVTGILSGI